MSLIKGQFMNKIIKFDICVIRKGYKSMCTPIDKIYGKSALQVLNKFGDLNSIPINLPNLLKKIGISALPMDFSQLEQKLNKKHILGLVLTKKEDAVIYYSKKDTPNRQRFTIAHELGHICSHLKPDSTDYPYIDWRIEGEANNIEEQNANIFAGELLIPLPILKEVYLSLRFPSSKDLASIFGTSVNVMEERLNYLRVSYYNKEGRAVVNTYEE